MIFGGTKGYVFALDENRGHEIWRTKLSTGSILNAASSGDVSVIVLEGVVVAGCNGHTWGIDKESGDIIWHNGLGGLGNGFVTLAAEGQSVQYIHRHTHTSS